MKNSIGKLMMIAAIGTILGCAVPGLGQTVDERIGRALAAINKDDLSAATTDLNEVFKADPKNPTAYYLRGMIDFKQAKYDEALTDQTKAIELNPNPTFPQFYYERGLTYQYRSKPDYKLALADFTKAIQIAPAYKNAYEKRAWSNFSLENWTAAESDYSQAIKLGSNTLAVYANRGAVNLNLKNYDQSIADSRKALEIDLTNTVVKRNLEKALSLQVPAPDQSLTAGLSVAKLLKRADYASKQGALDLEIQYLTAAIKADPKNIDAYEHRAMAYEALNKIDLALADYRQMEGFDPNNIEIYYLRASLFKNKKDYASAIPDYTTALGLKPNPHQSAQIYYERGLAYRETNEYDKAVVDLSKALELQPDIKSALTTRAEIYEFQGNYDLAEADMKKIQQIDPGNKFAEGELANIKMFKKAGFNTGKIKEDTLFKLDEYVKKITVDSEIWAKKLGLITTTSNENPKDTAKICGTVVDTDLALRNVESNVAKLNSLITDGKLEKLPAFKPMVLGMVNDFTESRTSLNKDTAKYGCKLN